jgi:hypothetical protein
VVLYDIPDVLRGSFISLTGGNLNLLPRLMLKAHGLWSRVVLGHDVVLLISHSLLASSFRIPLIFVIAVADPNL